jgi:uncharacterized iron-regulated membrane protein
VSNYTPTPYEQRPYRHLDDPIEPKMTYAEIATRAAADGKARGWTAPIGSINYGPAHGVYAVAFFEPGDEHGAAGVGPAQLYYDSEDGRPLGERLPWVGTAADVFVQMQFPLHSGRIAGLPGRILISLTGLVVAALSVTGVVIWWRKRRARICARETVRTRPERRLAPAE